MRMYRCAVQFTGFVSCEAESEAEAVRIIDGVLNNAEEVVFFEDGGVDNGGDELSATRARISRGDIRPEQ